MYWYIHEELAFLVEGHLHTFPFHWPVNDSLYILSDFVYYMILCVIGVAVVKPLIIHTSRVARLRRATAPDACPPLSNHVTQ